MHKQIHDCQAVLHSVASDHTAVRLKLTLLSIKFKAQAISWGTIDWPKIMLDDHTQMVYNEHLTLLTTPNMEYDDYQEIILQAGVVTATHHECQCEGWFQMSRITLAPLIKECNEILHAINCKLPIVTQDIMQAELKCLNHHVAHAVTHAKAKWYADICSKIHDM
jgi:hypothetical protein